MVVLNALVLLLLATFARPSRAVYCICKDGASIQAMQNDIDYACGSGADCSGIQQNGSCYQPNTVRDHCNYAVNSYFQRKGQSPGGLYPAAAPGNLYPASTVHHLHTGFWASKRSDRDDLSKGHVVCGFPGWVGGWWGQNPGEYGDDEKEKGGKSAEGGGGHSDKSMYMVENKGGAIACMLLSLVLLGTWPALFTLLERRGRLPQHTYLDYSLSNLLSALLLAFTLGQVGVSSPVSPNFLDQLSQDNWPSVLFAMAGGVFLSLGNLATQYALALVGLSVSVVITSSITVVIGTTVNYFLDNEINNPNVLFPGVACFVIAVCLASAVHTSNASDIEKQVQISGAGLEQSDVVDGLTEKAEGRVAEYLIEVDNRRAIKVLGKKPLLGLLISLSAGLCFALFSPAFNLATNDQWHLLKEGVAHLTVYTAFFYFSLSCFIVAIILNIVFLYRPVLDLPHSSFKAYLGDWNGRGWALLAGLLCGLGNGLQFMGGEAAGYAASDAVQALPLVSTFWGIVLFGEYRHSSRRTYWLLISMLFAFVVAVSLLIASAGQRDQNTGRFLFGLEFWSGKSSFPSIEGRLQHDPQQYSIESMGLEFSLHRLKFAIRLEDHNMLSSLNAEYNQVSTGNHERDWPGTGSFHRNMDTGGESGVLAETMFFTFLLRTRINFGRHMGYHTKCDVTFLRCNKEVLYLVQIIEHCLASAERQKQQWLILLVHRVLGYSSDATYAAEGSFGETMCKDSLQKLFWQKLKVDFAILGHVHSYERTCPVYQVLVEEILQRNIDGTVRIAAGGAGASLSPFMKLQTTWSLYRDFNHGLVKLTVFNHSNLLFEYKKSRDGMVYDSLWIKRDLPRYPGMHSG
ncbi:hypothetical protein MLD38_007454 [Melastoma candidum]|uniref:Uncharacterized protein n=1 Tax=Melastoma candidum TaxID=119954 RepID=A0ACB9RRQ0_9MYRT|nr:hypothetical protein MLD38_007454 [Melastoma candidum]